MTMDAGGDIGRGLDSGQSSVFPRGILSFTVVVGTTLRSFAPSPISAALLSTIYPLFEGKRETESEIEFEEGIFFFSVSCFLSRRRSEREKDLIIRSSDHPFD